YATRPGARRRRRRDARMYGETVSCAAETWFRCCSFLCCSSPTGLLARPGSGTCPYCHQSRHQSVPEHPARDARVPLISAVLGKRLLVPELVRRRPVRQLEQQRGADVVGAVGRADRSTKDEAVAVRREV